ncbi:hypothetical protein EDD17DRAFT_1517391 [Pisolithus thermaeus]|nr:hypothetical protein EDD17DRAFT_1517391 [Pisolithus thermaeus]
MVDHVVSCFLQLNVLAATCNPLASGDEDQNQNSGLRLSGKAFKREDVDALASGALYPNFIVRPTCHYDNPIFGPVCGSHDSWLVWNPDIVSVISILSAVTFTSRYHRLRKLQFTADAQLQYRYQAPLALCAIDPLVISAEIARLLELVQCLWEHLNSISSITKLPAEILLDIFQYIADSEAGGHSLVACSHVCRRWRVITITSPLLWARAINLADASERWVAMMIERSAPHLLDVSWDYTFNCSEIILELIVYQRDALAAANNISRVFSVPHQVHSVNLRLPLEHMVEIVSRIPTFMPNLETLVLTGYSSSEGLARSIIPMFELRAPALHHLRIENFGISWSLFRPESFCNLQHFTLCYLPMDSRLSLYNLMAFLVGMPLLRVLVIRQALQQSVPPSSTSRISFSHLHTIILEATVVHMAFLLRSFATPPLRLLEVHSGDTSIQTSTVDLSRLLLVVGECAQSTTYRTVEIHYHTTSIQVFGFPEVIGWDDVPTEPHAVHLSLEWSSITPWDTTQIAGSLPELLRHLYHPHCLPSTQPKILTVELVNVLSPHYGRGSIYKLLASPSQIFDGDATMAYSHGCHFQHGTPIDGCWMLPMPPRWSTICSSPPAHTSVESPERRDSRPLPAPGWRIHVVGRLSRNRNLGDLTDPDAPARHVGQQPPLPQGALTSTQDDFVTHPQKACQIPELQEPCLATQTTDETVRTRPY